MGARHAARTDHADHFGVFARDILGADAGVRADPHMLQIAVIDQRHGLGVFNIDQENQATELSRFDAIFFLRAAPSYSCS